MFVEKDHEVTHYACFEMLAKHGGKTECCHCTGHVCQKDKIAAATFSLDNKTNYTNEHPSPSHNR